MASRVFQYGRHRYDYELLKQQRRTISLTVEPCMDIILRAPVSTSNEQIQEFLEKKWMWLNKQLTFFERYQKKRYQKEYVSGESFYYLGRQYKLIVQEGASDTVKLTKGKLHLFTTQDTDKGSHNQRILSKWYRLRCFIIFQERYIDTLKRFDYSFIPELTIRAMPKRWGSCVKGERIILNPLLIQAPKEAIDYVITHELCHMKYKNHDSKFYNLLESKYPDWQKTKDKLERLV